MAQTEANETFASYRKFEKLVLLKGIDYFKLQNEEVFKNVENPTGPLAIISIVGKDFKSNAALLSNLIYFVSKWSNCEIDLDYIKNELHIANNCNDEGETGIVVWSKPFYVNNVGAGKRVPVFFLDIVGIPDDDSEESQQKYKILSALCMHLSSNVIHNVMGSIEVTHFNDLSEIILEGLRRGQCAKHQKLTVFISDWIDHNEYTNGASGSTGGQKIIGYLNKASKTNWNDIQKRFSYVECFLLPAKNGENDQRFDEEFNKFLVTILNPSYLIIKQFADQRTKCEDMSDKIQKFCSIDENAVIPELEDVETKMYFVTKVENDENDESDDSDSPMLVAHSPTGNSSSEEENTTTQASFSQWLSRQRLDVVELQRGSETVMSSLMMSTNEVEQILNKHRRDENSCIQFQIENSNYKRSSTAALELDNISNAYEPQPSRELLSSCVHTEKLQNDTNCITSTTVAFEMNNDSTETNFKSTLTNFEQLDKKAEFHDICRQFAAELGLNYYRLHLKQFGTNEEQLKDKIHKIVASACDFQTEEENPI